MKIVRDSAVCQEPAQPQAVSPEENRFSIRPRQIALFFLWIKELIMSAYDLRKQREEQDNW